MIWVGILSHKALSQKEKYTFRGEELKANSYSARLLLLSMYEKLYSRPLPEIQYTNAGKPYLFGDGEPHISLSHSDGYSAVCLCDESPCGVDIEEPQDATRRARVGERYLSKVNYNLHYPSSECEISLYEFNTGEGVSMVSTAFFPVIKEGYDNISGESSFSVFLSHYTVFESGWTLVEAALKCSGKGFRAFPVVSVLLERYSTLSLAARINTESCEDKLYLSLAIGDTPS